MGKLSAKSMMKRKRKKKATKEITTKEKKEEKKVEIEETEEMEHEEEMKQESYTEIEEEEFENKEDQDFSHLIDPAQAHCIKQGMWLIDDKSGYPVQVIQIKRSAPGKHGHAKFTLKSQCPFNGKAMHSMYAGTDQLNKAVMSKEEYLFVRFVDDDDQMVKVECSLVGSKNNKNKKSEIEIIALTLQARQREKVMTSLQKKRSEHDQVILTVLKGPKCSQNMKNIELIRCVVAAKIKSEKEN